MKHFSFLVHDFSLSLSFLPSVTTFFKIIGLQNELTKLGILKNQDDYENFWKLAQEGVHSSKLKEKLVDMKEKS